MLLTPAICLLHVYKISRPLIVTCTPNMHAVNTYMWQSQVENKHYSTISGLIQLVIIGVQRSYGEVASLFFRTQGGARRASRGEEKRRAWYPAIVHASEFGYFSGHFSIFTRENVIIIGVAS